MRNVRLYVCDLNVIIGYINLFLVLLIILEQVKCYNNNSKWLELFHETSFTNKIEFKHETGGKMSLVLDNIKDRITKLNKIIEEKENAFENAPEGIVNIAKTANRTQFYYKRNPSDKKRRYLRNDEMELVWKLCQKDYDKQVLETAKKELKCLEYLAKKYPFQTCEEIFEKLNEERKKYVIPIQYPEDIFVSKWESEQYMGKCFVEGTPEYYTQKGERVRSKSEILIANALYMHGVPYKFERPLYLKGYGTVHPDFTILNIGLRKEIYWEHLGKMDDPEYVEDNLRRIEAYEKNDFFLGDKLILTYETAKRPLNSRTIERMISKYLK